MGLGKEATSLHGTLKRCCYRSTCSHLLFTLGFTNSCLYFSYPTPSALLLLPFFPHSQPCRVKAVASFCLLPDLKLQLLPLVPGPPLRLGMAWAVAVQSCSTVRLSSTMGSLTQHRAPALNCRSWLMPRSTWALWWAKAAAALEPDCPWKCCSQQLHFWKCLWLR